MFLLYWTVTIVLSISVTAVVSESQVGTSGLTERTIVPSPTPDCQSPSCLTWSQCLADPSLCFSSYTTVTIQPGEYVLHEYVGVTGVESLSIYGSRSEVNNSARENQVTINCEYREGGIRFTAVINFRLSGITMVECGVKGANRGISGRELGFPYFALHVFEGVNVSLSFLFITNSTQIGLLCINPHGTSGIHDSVITHSNYRLLEKYMSGKAECSVDNRQCGGSNVWVLFYKTLITSINSTFVVERTVISYGVSLRPFHIAYSGGAGILFSLHRQLGYDVEITISRCHFTHNVGKVAAHLYLEIFSNNCSVLVEDSSFTFANRITEDDPLEVVPTAHHRLAAVSFIINDYAAAIDVELSLNTVYIEENVGGGLYVSRSTQSAHSYTQVWLKRIGMRHNVLVQDDVVHGYVFRFTKPRTFVGVVAHTLLESVEVSSNVVVVQDENRWTQEPFDNRSNICALSLLNSEVHFKHTVFVNDSIPAVFGYNSDLHFHGVNVFKNNTGRQCGGAIDLIMNSHIYLHRGTQVYILGNTALKYGGGICVDGGSFPEMLDACFYQIMDLEILNNYDTFVYMDGNVAPVTDYEIYAETVWNCITLINPEEQIYQENITTISHAIFAHVFLFGFLNVSLSV